MSHYKSAISFGLVHIPVVLNPIIKDNNTSFNYLHKKCGNRIKYIKHCSVCNKEVKAEDIVKGYEYQKDNYVTFDQEDFDKLKADGDKIIDIISFVDLKSIDPIYFEKSYALKTSTKNKAFNLFKKAMQKQNKIAIAKTILGNKEYYVTLRFAKGNIIMNTLYYQEEIRLEENETIEEFTKEELNLALKLIDSMEGKFEPEKYIDEYQNNIKKAIEQKIDGKAVKPIKSKRKSTINDLMEALEKSLKTKRTA